MPAFANLRSTSAVLRVRDAEVAARVEPPESVSRSMNRARASLVVQRVPPTCKLSRTTPRQPFTVHLYMHEMWGFLPLRRGGSSLAASAREMICSESGSIMVYLSYNGYRLPPYGMVDACSGESVLTQVYTYIPGEISLTVFFPLR